MVGRRTGSIRQHWKQWPRRCSEQSGATVIAGSSPSTQPAFAPTSTLKGAGIPCSPQPLLHVTLALCQVLALNLLPVPAAAANAAHAIQAILAAWAEQPNG